MTTKRKPPPTKAQRAAVDAAIRLLSDAGISGFEFGYLIEYLSLKQDARETVAELRTQGDKSPWTMADEVQNQYDAARDESGDFVSYHYDNIGETGARWDPDYRRRIK